MADRRAPAPARGYRSAMRLKNAAIACLALLGFAQLVPIARTNPAVEQEVDAPPEVRTVLERSCYDCHSHATRWPWYAWVAPVSWLVAHDVDEGREHLNFSTWNRYDAEERGENLEEIAEMVEEGEMPPWFYLPLHPEARLSDAELATLRAWTDTRPSGGGKRANRHEGHEH
jgi:mono/diheme cytochrome c family protein